MRQQDLEARADALLQASHAGRGDYPAYSEDYLQRVRPARRADNLRVSEIHVEQAELEDCHDYCESPTLIALRELRDAETRLIAKGILTQRDQAIIRAFRHHGSYVGVATRLQIHRVTVERHIRRIERTIACEAGVYMGWFWCWLEDVNRGKRYFEDE